VRPVNGKLASDAAPGWQVLLFAGAGFIGFQLILAFGDLVHKYTSGHRAYSDLIWVGLMLGGIVGAVFFYRLLAQGYHLGIGFFRGLQWYHWLWAVIFISGLVFHKRTAAEDVAAPVDSAALFRIVSVGGVGAVLLAALFLRRVEWLRSAFTGIIGVLLCFDLMTLLSTIWSVYWQWTFYKAVEYGVDVCMLAVAVYMVKTTADYKRFFDWTWVLYGVMLLNVWFGCVWDPRDALDKSGAFGEQGIGGLGVWLQGVIPDVSSNQIGEYAACFTAVALCRLLPINRKRKDTAWYWFLFLAGFVTIIFAQTRSALGGFCIAVFLIFLLSNRVQHGAAIVFSSVFAIFVTGFGDYLLIYLQRGQSANMMESFSGRLEWWQVAMEKLGDYPLTGLGMWAAARFGVLAKLGFTQTATIHSDWVEILVGTGAWGITPVIILLAMAWWVLVKNTLNPRISMEDRQLAFEGMAVLAVVSARMFFGTDLSLHPPCHYFAALGAAEFLRRKLKHRQVASRFRHTVLPSEPVLL
jgi:hypothetical protein